MKKFFAFFIACILVMQFAFIPASAEGAEYEPYLKSVQETGSYVGDIEELRYYSFRYTKDPSFAWFRENVIGPNRCKEGYLYVKDLVKEEIRQVSAEPIKAYERIDDDLFFANQSNEIIRTGVSALEQAVVYKADQDITSMCFDADTLYFADGNTVKAWSIDAQNVETVAFCEGISQLYMNHDGQFVWENASGEAFAHSFADNSDTLLEQKPVIDYSQEFSELVDSSDGIPEIDTYAFGAPVTFPLPEYPAWSYFSDDGTPCTHHARVQCEYGKAGCHCKPYGWAIQCVAFAKYASDRYAHKSSWSPVYGDRVEGGNLSSSDSARVFFAKVSRGAYVTGVNHSFAVRYTTASAVYTYECNNGGSDCHISLETRNYNSFTGDMAEIEFAYSHHFNGTAKSISSSYHMIPCTSSGCNGYEVKEHYSGNPGSNATCTACGYVGKIDMGVGTYSKLTP